MKLKILKKMGVKIIILSKNSITNFQKSKNLKKINNFYKTLSRFSNRFTSSINGFNDPSKGLSKIKENIFENRFMHVPELKRMGAKIEIKNKTAFIFGPTKLLLELK